MNVNPKRCASGQKCEPETLVESIYCLVHHSRIPLKAIAEAIGHRPTYLAQAANADYDAVAFQVASLVPAMRAADNYGPLRFMSQQCGFVLVRLPQHGDGADDVRMRFMATAKELGDVAQEIERALAGDNDIDGAEFNRIDRELSEAVESIAQLRHVLAKKAGKA